MIGMNNPSLPPAETTAVYALIALISDPKASKERLDEIKAASDDVNARINKLMADSVTLTQAQADWDKDTAAREFDLNEHKAELAKIRDDLNKREQSVVNREQDVAKASIAAEAKAADLAARDTAVSARERTVTQSEVGLAARHDALDARETDLNAKVEDYNNRLKQLKALAS